MKKAFRIACSLILSLGLLVLSGCSESVKLSNQGQALVKYGQFPQAQEKLTQSLNYDYENAEAHYWLGRCYHAEGKIEKAIYQYSLAVRFVPSKDVYQVTYIKSLYNNGQKNEAFEAAQTFLRLTKKDPTYTQDKIVLAQHFAQSGMLDLAMMTCDYATVQDPGNASPVVAKADLYFKSGQKQVGVETLREAFRIDPYFPGLASRLGTHGLRVNIPQSDQKVRGGSPLEQQLSTL